MKAEAKPTIQSGRELQAAYDHFNKRLFGGTLPPCLITLHRENPRTLGYFARERFVTMDDGRRVTDEIALNPTWFQRQGTVEVLSTLAHEMAHLWQAHQGTPSRKGYHNAEWAAKMIEVGLQPTNTGKAGGKVTGQKMTHYIIDGGRFQRSALALLRAGFTLTWGDAWTPKGDEEPKKAGTRTRYDCPDCGSKVWGKPDLQISCIPCEQPMLAQPTGE